MKKILITGGAGFIGSHVVKLFVNKYVDYHVFNLDKLTYAGNLENLKSIENSPNYTFIKGDITDGLFISQLFENQQFDGVIHLAAESHVDRSIADPMAFIHTNIVGTANLLNAALKIWEGHFEGKLFYHISTDEVYGSLGENDAAFTEQTPYCPHSPYSASKAASDHLVRAYYDTYGLPTVISNCSNNYGPYQFPEKLLPLCINNILNNKPLPVYGKGLNVRDWLYVKDHADAIDCVFHAGEKGQTYNIGGNNEWRNIDLIEKLIEITDNQLNRPKGTSQKLITFVKDRAGHDLRYAINAKKIHTQLGWCPKVAFDEGFALTVKWYLDNSDWLKNVTTGEYQNYYNKMYLERK
ncbi:MAG: dTDP-glucose 4,6-dehydratase [Bacteroidales bacterium]|jgi:dTDP-glucose 4,6-dehydratase|nr:dTDP-glucose 4,6-dehydratase [Bacteroidales bacterium]